jgi:SAM-dependent methyltransferase
VNRQLERVRRAYDLTVVQHEHGIDPVEHLPARLKAFVERLGGTNDSASADIFEYLSPKAGMRFLDAGCCANLANYRLDRWPSLYYGVDFSPALIRAMTSFVLRKRIRIGGLWRAEIVDLPFADRFFDIAAVIGVLEYYALDYVGAALREVHRVLKPRARIVMDIPNPGHPDIGLANELERFLKRPNVAKSRADFERLLGGLFVVRRVDDTQVMLKYFLRRS